MGYTHYWYVNPKADKESYTKALDAVDTIMRHGESKGVLGGPMGEGDKIENNERWIAFNGLGDNAHETFAVNKTPESYLSGRFVQTNDDGHVFEFCKTRQKPYDNYVVACLCAMKHFMGDDLRVSSDGDASDFTAGIILAKSLLNVDIQNPLDPDGDQESK